MAFSNSVFAALYRSLIWAFQSNPIWDCIMLQKLSKCEVKAWLCWNLFYLPPLRLYVKSNFGEFQQSKNVNFGNFRNCELGILVNLRLDSCSKLLKSKFKTFKIARNDIFGPFEFAKIWFHAKSEWQKMIKFKQSQA